MSRYARRSLLCWLALSPLVLVTLFPFAVMLSTALKPAAEVLSAAPSWLPSRIAWQNFPRMWAELGFGQALANSLYVSLGATALTLLISVPAAYALSRYRFRLRGAYQRFLLVTQMLSPVVLVLGLFKLGAALHLLNSLTALAAVYAAFQITFAVWMLRSYFDTIPVELEEAAWLEGASRLRAVTGVFLPVALPALAVTAIFTFINGWNEFVLALTLLRSPDEYTLPIQIFSQVAGRYSIAWEQVMAAVLLATVPVAVAFLWLQRYLVGGLTLGAVK